jgi:alpha-galactosidase
MTEKIVLLGAGSAMFTIGVVSDLVQSGQPVELALVDIDPAALDVAHKLVKKMVAARRAPVRVTASIDRRKVLPGATAVISAIGVGGRRAWEQDVFIPRKYGLYMPVGDTAGPSGTSRALRMIPAMVAIARDVLDLCPDALFFNYANPMSPVCRAVRKATGAEMVGLCIGTWDTAHYLADTLQEPFEDLAYNVTGINHLTWFSEVDVRGQDAMPALKAHAARAVERVNRAYADFRTNGIPMPGGGGAFGTSLGFPFAWQCLLWFGAFPSPEDRHVTEFFPQLFRDGSYYGKKLGVDEFSFERTIEVGDEIYAGMRADALSPEPLTEGYFEKHGGEQEQVIEIIRAIRANRPMTFFANLPNQGQAPNLPLGAVVETPAVTTGSGIRALTQKPLPPAAAGALAGRFAWVEAVVEAALEKSRDKFIQALILDGAVTAPDVAVALADDLLAAQAEYLDWE